MELTERADLLRRALTARSIAIVGASERNWFSRNVLDNLRNKGFTGEVVPINPRGGTVLGLQAYPSLAEAPQAEVVVVATARDRFEQVVAEIAVTDAVAVVALTSGLAESGDPYWVEVEAAARRTLAKAGMVLIGPNGLGFLDNVSALYSWSSPVPWELSPGGTSFVMESGGLLCGCLAAASAAGIGVGSAACIGNGHGIGTADWIAALAGTDRLGLMLESLPQWSDLAPAVRRAREAGTTLFALKSGRSSTGAEVAATHTGALAGDYPVASGVLAQLGVHEVPSMGGLMAALALHDRFGDAAGGTIALVGASGGAMGVVADAMDDRDLALRPFSAALRGTLRGRLGITTAQNPMDVGGQALSNPQEFREVVADVLRDPQVGAVVYVPSLGLPGPELPSHLELLELLAGAAAEVGKPVVVTQLVSTAASSGAQVRFRDDRSLVIVPSLESALDGLKAWLDTGSPTQGAIPPEAGPGTVAEVAESDEVALKADLAAAGLAVPAALTYVPGEGPASTPFARAVLKAVVPGVLHKSRLGLVELEITDTAALRRAEAAIVSAATAAGLELPLLLLEEMAGPGPDLFLSASRQPFGTAVTIGLGGVDVEATGRVAFLGWPATAAETDSVIARRLPELTTDQRSAVAGAVGALMNVYAEAGYSTLECNPVRLTDGAAVALDAVATTTAPDQPVPLDSEGADR